MVKFQHGRTNWSCSGSIEKVNPPSAPRYPTPRITISEKWFYKKYILACHRAIQQENKYAFYAYNTLSLLASWHQHYHQSRGRLNLPPLSVRRWWCKWRRRENIERRWTIQVLSLYLTWHGPIMHSARTIHTRVVRCMHADCVWLRSVRSSTDCCILISCV